MLDTTAISVHKIDYIYIYIYSIQTWLPNPQPIDKETPRVVANEKETNTKRAQSIGKRQFNVWIVRLCVVGFFFRSFYATASLPSAIIYRRYVLRWCNFETPFSGSDVSRNRYLTRVFRFSTVCAKTRPNSASKGDFSKALLLWNSCDASTLIV